MVPAAGGPALQGQSWGVVPRSMVESMGRIDATGLAWPGRQRRQGAEDRRPPLSLILLLTAAPLPRSPNGPFMRRSRGHESEGDGVDTSLIGNASSSWCLPPSLPLPSPSSLLASIEMASSSCARVRNKERKENRGEISVVFDTRPFRPSPAHCCHCHR